MIQLVALKELTYRGRALKPGEPFEAAPVDAAAFRYQKIADFADGKSPKPAAKKRRQYHRRDLQAQE